MRDRIDDVSKGIDSYQSPSLVVRSLGAVEMMAVRWLWRNRLARGVLTLNAGPPGAGKSTWLVDCVARTTVGSSGFLEPRTGYCTPFQGAERF